MEGNNNNNHHNNNNNNNNNFIRKYGIIMGVICPTVKKKFSVQKKTVQLWLVQNLQNHAEVCTRVTGFTSSTMTTTVNNSNFSNKFCSY
jgi:hypothetical protein